MALLAVLCHAGFSQASVFSHWMYYSFSYGTVVSNPGPFLSFFFVFIFVTIVRFCPAVVNIVDTSTPER